VGWLTSEYTAGAVPCVGFATKTNNDRIKSLHFWVTAVLLLLHQRTSRRCKKNPADECTVSVMLLLHQRTSRRCKKNPADECTVSVMPILHQRTSRRCKKKQQMNAL